MIYTVTIGVLFAFLIWFGSSIVIRVIDYSYLAETSEKVSVAWYNSYFD